VLHYQPAEEQLREQFEGLFGDKGVLPLCTRRAYDLLPPDAAHKAAWDRARRAVAEQPRLPDLVGVYEPLTKADDKDAAAWFNLGLAHAWMGDNRSALEAMNRYLELESDDARAETAATLTEVLRTGAGLEDDCDYHEYAFGFPLRDAAPMQALVQEWADGGRLVPIRQGQEDGAFLAILLDIGTTGLITASGPAKETARMAGYLAVVQGVVRLHGTDKETMERLREEVRARMNLPLGEAPVRRGHVVYGDVVNDALTMPTRSEGGPQLAVSNAQKYYEETWVHRPRRSLMNNTPVDAAGHAALQKRLRGVIRFIQDCAVAGLLAGYDFDRLRRKLGLLSGEAAAATPTGATPEISSLGAAELAGLKVESLGEEQLEQAFQTAQKLDAQELAQHFAQALLSRPSGPGRGDRYSVYSYLIQRSLKDGALDAALDHVNEGEKADCEQNEGRRRNDYELRRAQVHTKRGEAEQAEDVYRRLIERSPSEMKYRGGAAEAMLTLKQGARALRFAEEGLQEARKQKDRDSEQYLLELAGAARKQMG
jgi:tetratricopeptide (TPR) repeat protein